MGVVRIASAPSYTYSIIHVLDKSREPMLARLPGCT